MSLKDNFNQAVKELLKRDGLVGPDLSKGAKEKSELDRFIDSQSETTAEAVTNKAESQIENTVPTVKAEPAAVKEAPKQEQPKPATQTPVFPQSNTAPQTQTTAPRQQPVFPDNKRIGGGQTPPPATPPRTPSPVPSEPYFETEETTIISRNTIIDGNVRSFANINVEGSIKGDVQITKNANVSGKIVGDLECNNATMLGSSMQGNIASKGQVKLDKDSLVLGDISAQYLDLNGKIKGNVEVGGKAEFKTDAVILGNINAATITVLDGATIQGFVNTTFLQDNAQNIFPEEISVQAE